MATLYVIPMGMGTAFFDGAFPADTSFKSAVPSAELVMQPGIGSVLSFLHQREVTGSSATPVAGANWDEILDKNGSPWGGSLNEVVENILQAQKDAAAGSGGGGGGDNTKFAWESIVYDPDYNIYARRISKYDATTGATTVVYQDIATGIEYSTDPYLLFDSVSYQRDMSDNLTNLIASLRCNVPKTVSQTIRAAGTHGISSGSATRLRVIALAGATFSIGALTYPIAIAGSGTIADFDISAGVGRVLGAISYTVLTGTVLEIVEN